MMNLFVLDIAAIVAALAFIRLLFLWRNRRGRGYGVPLPPGPKGLPIIGNVFDLPSENEWETLRQLGEGNGGLVYIKKFGTGYLFLNNFEAAVELFERRGMIYSSRPNTTMLELEGWNEWFISLMPNSNDHRKFRQFINKFFQKSAARKFCEVQTQSTRKLLFKLLQNPDAYVQHVKHWAAETIVKITYGFQITENDPNVDLIGEGIGAAADALKFFAVNALPALRYLPTWFPGAHFQKIAREGRKLSEAMYNEPFKEAQRKTAEGLTIPSMMSKLMESCASSSDEAVIAKSVAVIYGAGGDTTVGALLIFILAMVLHPDAMVKGQEEIERVIGGGRLPTLEDRPKLAYVEAICTECLRWQPMTPLALPHLLTQDDIYNGYFIPAGTTLYGNVWAMSRDPKLYSEPDKFMPERWLPGPDKERPLEANKIAFGFGRRICPGRFFAESSVFIAAASILSVFDILKAVDDQGVQIVPNEGLTSSIVRHPKPFKCSIKPRSEEAAALIHEAVASVN